MLFMGQVLKLTNSCLYMVFLLQIAWIFLQSMQKMANKKRVTSFQDSTMSYFFTERNFYSVMWELGDKEVQKNVYMVYEYPFCISKKNFFEKVCTKKIRLIFQSAAGFEPTETAKYRALKDWSLSYRSHEVVY